VISGDTANQPAAWRPTPDQIDSVIGQLTGGVGREIGKLAQTISAPFTGDELTAHNIPLLGRLYGGTQGVSAESELLCTNIKRLNQIENEYKGRMNAGEDAESFRRQEPLVDQIGLGNQAEAAISRVPRPKCPHRYPELAPLDPIKGGSIRPISDRPLKQLSSRPDR
jgi:hypothetical protein